MAFRLPPPVRPTFDPRMMGGDEMPTVTALDQPPPMPKMAAPPMPAPPPPQQPAMPQARPALDQMREMGPPPMPKMSGWRGYVAAGLSGGLPGLAMHALAPDAQQQQAEYANKQRYLTQMAGLEHTAKQDEESEMRRKAYQQNIDSQVQGRIDAAAARDEAREQGFIDKGWRIPAPGSVMPPMPKDGRATVEAQEIGGRMRYRTTDYGKALEKQDAEQANWREVPPTIAAKLNLKPGTKVPPNELDGYLRIVQSAEDKENDRAARAELQNERLEVTKSLAAIAAATRTANASTTSEDRNFRRADAQGKRFMSLPEVKQYNEVAPFIANIREHAKTLDNPASQLALLYNYIKVNDPGSVVREGEVALVREGESLTSNAQRMYNKLLQGGVASPKLLGQIVSASDATFKVADERYKAKLKQFRDVVRANNLDEEVVFGKTTPEIDAELGPQKPPKPVGESVKPIVQRSKSTGQYRHSLDGGKTWQPGQPK